MLRISSCLLILFLFSVSASAGITISGKLTGADGKPMSVANVFLTYPGDNRPIKSVEVRKDGDFRIPIDSEGLWTLHFTGTFHREYEIAIYADNEKDIRLDVRLGTYRYQTNFDRAAVIGNFNRWSFARRVYLKKDKDSNYSAIVDCKLDTIIYRLVDVRTGGDFEGTSAMRYVPNGIDGYSALMIAKKGKVRILLDPHKLVESDLPASFKVIAADSIESRFAKSYAIFEDTRQAYTSSLYWHVAELKMGSFKFDFKPVIDSVKNLLNVEPEGLIRQVLQFDYFGLTDLSTFTHYVDVKTSRETLTGVSPSSVIWSLAPELLSDALNQASFGPYQRKEYIQKVLDTNPMPGTKEVLLRDEIVRNFHSLHYNQIPPYLEPLVDQYGDSPEAQNEGKLYSADYLRLKDGAQAPAFSVRSLPDSIHLFTNDSFKGKYYLLNFWATTSATSLDEIKNLQNAYDLYKQKGLVILSISLDSTAENVIKFRQGKWKMPWMSAIVDSSFDSQICKPFEVYSLPKSVLVNPEGKIVAEGWELRGSNFLKTLRKYLGK